MEGPLAGGLAAPDRPRGPERLPGPAPREDIEGGAEAAEGEGSGFRSTHYLPITKEGPRDILDGRGGVSGKRGHPVGPPGSEMERARSPSLAGAEFGIQLLREYTAFSWPSSQHPPVQRCKQTLWVPPGWQRLGLKLGLAQLSPLKWTLIKTGCPSLHPGLLVPLGNPAPRLSQVSLAVLVA